MNKITRIKGTDIIRAWSADGKFIAVAGCVKELLSKNILSEYHGNQNGWIIIPADVNENIQESILYDTRESAKEALKNYPA